MPAPPDAVLIPTATGGTTLAPWGLSFIQSYAVDRLTVDNLRYERGVAIESTADAARACIVAALAFTLL